MTDKDIAKIKLLKALNSEILLEESRKYYCVHCLFHLDDCREMRKESEKIIFDDHTWIWTCCM